MGLLGADGELGSSRGRLVREQPADDGGCPWLVSRPAGVGDAGCDHRRCGVAAARDPNGYTPGDRVARSISPSDFSDNFTAELWIYPLADGSAQFLIGKGNPLRAGPYGWGLMMNGSSGSDRLYLVVNASAPILGPSIPPNAWTYVAVRRSAGAWTIFADGLAFGSSAVQPNAGGPDVFFGADAWGGGGFNFKGRIAQGAFYATALSDAQIQAHYDAMPVVDLPLTETYGMPGASAACGTFACNPSGTQAEPVNTATGSYRTEVTDLALPGIGVPFTLVRTYNSADTSTGVLGPGWTHSLNASLKILASGDVVGRGPDGQQLAFTKRADGSLRAARGGRATLSTISGGYELVTADQMHLRFDSQGRLTSERDRNGKGPCARLRSKREARNRHRQRESSGQLRLQRLGSADERDAAGRPTRQLRVHERTAELGHRRSRRNHQLHLRQRRPFEQDHRPEQPFDHRCEQPHHRLLLRC